MNFTIDIPVISDYLDTFTGKSISESTGKVFTDITYWTDPFIRMISGLFAGDPYYGTLLVIVLLVFAFMLYKINTVSSSGSQYTWLIMTFFIIFVIVMFLA